MTIYCTSTAYVCTSVLGDLKWRPRSRMHTARPAVKAILYRATQLFKTREILQHSTCGVMHCIAQHVSDSLVGGVRCIEVRNICLARQPRNHRNPNRSRMRMHRIHSMLATRHIEVHTIICCTRFRACIEVYNMCTTVVVSYRIV